MSSRHSVPIYFQSESGGFLSAFPSPFGCASANSADSQQRRGDGDDVRLQMVGLSLEFLDLVRGCLTRRVCVWRGGLIGE
jgi:hypothetical protein